MKKEFTETDVRFAYMQGYNRGIDGNPNQMESYIASLTKTPDVKISDEEIEKEAEKRSYSEVDLIAFYNFLENHSLRKYGDVWKRITNDQNDKPLNFESVDDQYIIEWFEQFKKK